MIRTETIGDRVRTYSDAGLKLRQLETGILYDDAVDVPGLYTYEETDQPIDEIDTSDNTEQLAEAARILLGMEE